MIPARLIARKRDGGTLTATEVEAFFDGYRAGDVAEYQVAAMLMAIYFRGMEPGETSALTRVMIDSGETWSWPASGGPVADKHSTGGVGDKVSLIVAPLAAACGLRVPMVSGRGLGHTGGTLDKLESIPGFRTELERSDFSSLLASVGYAMGGQTSTFAPLDKELYALRDVTGTVESIPLITASIMSKKIAEGLDALVSDVKWGDGAFMRKREDAETLARALIATGAEFGVPTAALLTDMNAPLGRAVGHAVEVRESIDLLAGRAVEPRLRDVSVALTAEMLTLSGAEHDPIAARARVEDALESGAGLETFRANVESQGGDARVVDDPAATLPSAPAVRRVTAGREAVIAAIPARAVGEALVELGGGRRVKRDTIDLAVGFEFPFTVGDRVPLGEAWCIVHGRTEADAEHVASRLADQVRWSDDPVDVGPVVTDRLNGGA